jgi:hypothetical protein
VELESVHDAPPELPPWDRLSPAARFNALDEWGKADALYDEVEAIRLLGAASPAAIASAEDALTRAWDDAEQLAPLVFVLPETDHGWAASGDARVMESALPVRYLWA